MVLSGTQRYSGFGLFLCEQMYIIFYFNSRHITAQYGSKHSNLGIKFKFMAFCELGVANGSRTIWELDNELNFGKM